LVFSARYGYKYLNDKGNTYGLPTNTLILYSTCNNVATTCKAGNAGDPGVSYILGPMGLLPPASVQQASGFQNSSSTFNTLFDITTRHNLYLDGSYLLRIGGQDHFIKGGFALNRIENRVKDDYANGFFYLPTLVADVAPGSRLLTEEVFGPVLPIVVVKGLEEAIERANDTKYGLGSSIWTTDLEKARVACERLESGITWVNQHVKLPPEVPFGGVKESGIGRENGLEAIDAYCEMKSIML
jgi:hypothetical protein